MLVGAVLLLTLALPAGQRISAAVAADRVERAEQMASRGFEQATTKITAVARRLDVADGHVDTGRARAMIAEAFEPIPASIDERGLVHVGPVYAEPGMDESYRLTFRLHGREPLIRVQSRGFAGGSRATIERDLRLVSPPSDG